MSEIIDPEIFTEYLAEVFESLEGLDEKFVALEKNPDDVKIIDSIFRPVHSIKGSSAFFGLNHVKNFSHKLENLLDDLRKGKKRVTQTIIDNLLKGTDYLKEIFRRVADGDASYALTPEEENFIGNLEQRIIDKEEAKSDDGLDVYLYKMATIVEKIRGLDLGEKGNGLAAELEQNLILVRTLAGSGKEDGKPQKIGEILVESEGIKPEQVEKALEDQQPDEKLGEVLVKKGVVSKETVSDAMDIQKKQNKDITAAKFAVQKTMRIAEEKVDEFMDQIGELVIISEVFNYLERRLSTLPGSVKITKEFKNVNMNFSELTYRLQEGLSEVRKVSIKTLFQKMPRLVRDLAASLSKNVDIRLEGEEIMVDKSLLEKFESPIIHMVRNAVDHGIEMPEARKSNGKPEMGTIRLTAEIEGELLIIKLEDDGAGISRKKLLEKGIDRGFISAQAGGALSDREVFDFIFHAGFSLADKVTDVSGRGVGMDVVKNALAELKGKIEVDSTYGKGSTFTISLPVSTTLITITGLVVKVGKGKFILPVEDVKESFRPTNGEVFTVRERSEMVNIRGDIYPLIRLYKNFRIETTVTNPTDGVGIIIEKNGRRCCVMADSIIEQQNVVLKDLGRVFSSVRGVKGGAILGDGSIGLVLNVDGLMGVN
ncbi:MAG: chemotaxis protein CheA [bacterium]|nr:MAG: chemotaxis protein CheA [bacterium]